MYLFRKDPIGLHCRDDSLGKSDQLVGRYIYHVAMPDVYLCIASVTGEIKFLELLLKKIL